MGITAAALLTVAPVAMPVINSATEITVKADVSDVYKANAQKWANEVKSQFTSPSQLITNDDSRMYLLGSDGLFVMDAQSLTPDSKHSEIYSSDDTNTDDFFDHFNDNSNKDNLFFGDGHVAVLVTATDNNGTISGNLIPRDMNKVLSIENGKGLTFHLELKYTDTDTNDVADGIPSWESHLAMWDKFVNNSTQLASKDVVVLPVKSTTNTDNSDKNTDTNTNTNTNTGTTLPGTSVKGTFETSIDAPLYTADGKAVTSRELGKNTAWAFNRKQTIDGVTYYRVSSNEWVKASDGFEYTANNVVVTTTKQATLYNGKGETVSNRALGANTPWRSDRTAIINGQKMYRVATNEWVPASEIK